MPESGLIPYDHFKDTKYCICCKTNKGQIKYGLIVCPSCDETIFRKSQPNIMIDHRLYTWTIDTHYNHPKYPGLSVCYYFASNTTAIYDNTYNTINPRPFIVFSHILPMNQQFIDKLPDKLQTWLLFS